MATDSSVIEEEQGATEADEAALDELMQEVVEAGDEPAAEPPVGENHASLDAALAAQQGTTAPQQGTSTGQTAAKAAPEPGTPGYFTGAAPAAAAAPWAAAIGTDAPRPGWPGPPPVTPDPKAGP